MPRGAYAGVVYWLAFIGLLIWALHHDLSVSAVPSSQAPHESSGSAAAKNENPQSHAPETFWQRATNDPMAIFTLALVGFTGVLAVSTIGLWLATLRLWRSSDRHVAHAEDTAERQLRAYLAFSVGQHITIKDRQLTEGWMVITNHGQTPAYECISWVACAIMSMKVVPEVFDAARAGRDSTLRSKSIIHPGEPHRVTIFPPPPPTQEQNRGISDGTLRIYVFGEVTYTDAFNKKRMTTFCRFLVRENEGSDGKLHTAEEGNTAT